MKQIPSQPVPGPLHHRPALPVLHPCPCHVPRCSCQVGHRSVAGDSNVGIFTTKEDISTKDTQIPQTKCCSPIIILLRGISLLSTWSGWTPRRGRRPRKSRRWDYRGLLGLASSGTNFKSTICHCPMATYSICCLCESVKDVFIELCPLCVFFFVANSKLNVREKLPKIKLRQWFVLKSM